MIRALVILVVTLAGATAAAAQDRAAPILALLERLPMPPGDGIVEVDYGNPVPVRGAALMAAALGQTDDDPTLAPFMRTVPSLLGQRMMPVIDELPDLFGIDPLLADGFAMAVQERRRVLLMVLPEGSGAAVTPTLAASDLAYGERQVAGQSVWWRGEDFETDLSARSDPFGFGLGQSSRLWIVGDLLVQAVSWDMMQRAMAAPDGSVGADADAAALVAALDAGLDAPGQVAALRLYLNLPDSYPGRAVMVADMIHGGHDGAVFAVVTDTGAEAEGLADAARTNWDGGPSLQTRRTMAEMMPGEMQATVLGGDGPPVMAITVYGRRDDSRPFWQNATSIRFNQRLMAGDMGWLDP